MGGGGTQAVWSTRQQSDVHMAQEEVSACSNSFVSLCDMLFVGVEKGRRNASVLAQKAQVGKRVPLDSTSCGTAVRHTRSVKKTTAVSIEPRGSRARRRHQRGTFHCTSQPRRGTRICLGTVRELLDDKKKYVERRATHAYEAEQGVQPLLQGTDCAEQWAA
jgi:hypothetical protein